MEGSILHHWGAIPHSLDSASAEGGLVSAASVSLLGEVN